MNSRAFLATILLVAVPAAARPQTSPDLLERVQGYIDSVTAHSAIPGLTLGLALPDGSSLGFASGWADTAVAREMRSSDRMLQGSVGKTYFGAVALQLVAEGRLDLDARLAEYLGAEPWFDRLPNAREVTVRQLMNHTSGIVRYELNPAFLTDLRENPLRTWGQDERLAYLFDMEPPFPAGEGWDYSDTNYILLAMAAERVLGTPVYDEIDRRLLEPLGLENTVRSDRPDVPGIANGYAGPSNPFGAFDATVERGRLVFNPQFEWAGGGFASTAEDLAVWTRHVHEGRAFDPGLFDDFRRGVDAPLGPQASYGLGVIMMEMRVGRAWGHSGFMPGYRTEAYYFPDHGFAAALQINSSDGTAYDRPPLRILDELAGIVRDALRGMR